MCGYKLDIDASSNPITIQVFSPEGSLVAQVSGATVAEAVEAAAPVIDQDIATFGCDAPWSL